MRIGPTPSRGCESGLRIEISPLLPNPHERGYLRNFLFFVGETGVRFRTDFWRPFSPHLLVSDTTHFFFEKVDSYYEILVEVTVLFGRSDLGPGNSGTSPARHLSLYRHRNPRIQLSRNWKHHLWVAHFGCRGNSPIHRGLDAVLRMW